MATAFPIGVSSQPINIAGAGVNFMRSAVDAKLREIEQNREEIGENAKNTLKAMSISTIEGLSGSIRDRYQGEIENYRNTVIDKFKNSGGKLSLQQQKEIQDGFVDLTKRMQGDVTSLKKMEEVQKLYLANPYAYQESLPQELRSMQLDLEKGKAIEDPMLLPLKNAVPISTSDYVLKKYAAPIKNLNIETKAGFTGNIFSETETRGMGVVDPASRQKAIDLRDEIMRDSWVKYRAGEIDSETYNREKKTVEDAINQVISQSKPFRQTTGRSGSGRQPYDAYISYEQDVEEIPSGKNKVTSTYSANVPTTEVAPFSFNGKKVTSEAIQFHNVAVNPNELRKKLIKKYTQQFSGRSETPEVDAQIKVDKMLSKEGVIGDEFIGDVDSNDFTVKPMAKLVSPKDKNIYFTGYDDLMSKTSNVDVTYVPFEGNVRDAIYGKMGTKRVGYEQKIKEAEGRLGGQPKQSTSKQVGIKASDPLGIL